MNNTNKINEPKLNIKFTGDRAVDVNSTLTEIVEAMNERNVLECVKLMKVKYFVSYSGIAGVMGVSTSAINRALMLDSIEAVISEARIKQGILNLKDYFLGEVNVDNVEFEEVGA